VIRARFSDYLLRFIRLASRYEEEVFASTSIGYPSISYSPANGGRLGSGAVFSDDASRQREMAANIGRIEGWRMTRSYQLWRQVSSASFGPETESLLKTVYIVFQREIAQESDPGIRLGTPDRKAKARSQDAVGRSRADLQDSLPSRPD
jgi:hypothetical protein